MHYQSLISLPATLAVAALVMVPALHAQAEFAAPANTTQLSATSLLTALSHYRAVRWASASAVVHCSPAPLTERPGFRDEVARPHVVPLEEAFADAASVKRAMEYRSRAVALERR